VYRAATGYRPAHGTISAVSARNRWLIVVLAAVAAAFAFYVAAHPMDLRVYHYGARGFIDGTRPMYGMTSGLGWPLHYRYPPLFMFLFWPLSLFPLGLSAAIWVVLKFVVLVLLVHAFLRRFATPTTSYEWLIAFFVGGAYVVEDFRYGNAQFFVFALVAASLMTSQDRPRISGLALGLGIALKVWPLFFIPYLVARREWRVSAWALVLAIVFTLVPALWLGFNRNLELLGEWTAQEFSTQLGENEIWFPNQSLRGVMMRYLTRIDYSALPDSNYSTIDVVQWDPRIVRSGWLVAASTLYAGLLFVAWRHRNSSGLVEHALAFCLLALLEPFTQKYAMVVLAWPALASGRIASLAPARLLVYPAIILILVQPILPGADWQRFVQVLGFDFAANLLLTAAMAYAAVKFSAHSFRRNIRVTSVGDPAHIETS
jgi:uncharacterized membrane protein